MTRRVQPPPKPRSSSLAPSPAASDERVDRVLLLLEHANPTADAVQFREENAAGRWEYLDQYDVDTVRAAGLEAFAAERYGGGKFKAGLRNRQTGEYGASVVFHVAGPRKTPLEREQRSGRVAPAASPAPRTNEPPAWVERIVLPIGATFATAFGTFLAKKLLEGPATRDTDPAILELIKQLGRDRRGGDGQTAASDPIEMLNRVLELQDHLSERLPRESAETGFGKVIEQTVPQLVSVLNRKLDIDERRMTTRRLPPARSGAEAPLGAAAPPAPPHERPTDTGAEREPAEPSGDQLADLVATIPLLARHYLLNKAKSGSDAALYAEVVLDELTDDAYALLPALLARGDVVDVLVAVVPAWAPYRAWFGDLITAMRASLDGDVETETDTAGGPSGAAHPSPGDGVLCLSTEERRTA